MMNEIIWLPVLLPFLAAAVAPLAVHTRRMRAPFLIGVTGLELICAAYLLLAGQDASAQLPHYRIALTAQDFHGLYLTVTAALWLCAALMAIPYFKEHTQDLGSFDAFFFLTLGATAGVFLSADLITLLIFFEIMSVASFVWVIHDRTRRAAHAAGVYLGIAIFGGMAALMGILLVDHAAGTTVISEIAASGALADHRTELIVAGFLLLIGFGAKAGLFPLHVWLPLAHPVAPAPASALLSGILTKTGVWGALIIVAQILPGVSLFFGVLLAAALITMVLGAVLALLSSDLKYTLACSSLSQIGFILTGVAMLGFLGAENSSAAYGVIAYMLNHSVVKIVLFLAAGAFFCARHTLNLTELRGAGKGHPVLHVAFLLGAASLCGIPCTLGYVGKTLIHESIVEYSAQGGSIFSVVEWVFLLSGGLTVAYMTKLYICLFWQKPLGTVDADSPLSAAAGISVAVPALLLLSGVLPALAIEPLCRIGLPFLSGREFAEPVSYFSLRNLSGFLISAAAGAVVYLLVVRRVLIHDGSYRDADASLPSLTDRVYLPLCRNSVTALTVLCRVPDQAVDLCAYLLRRYVLYGTAPRRYHPHKLLVRIGEMIDRRRKPAEGEPAASAVLIQWWEAAADTTRRVLGNFSFALLMTCLGISVLLIYLFIIA